MRLYWVLKIIFETKSQKLDHLHYQYRQSIHGLYHLVIFPFWYKSKNLFIRKHKV